MKTFIKQNWFKVVVLIILLILAIFSIFYLPKTKQIDIRNQENCSKKAEEIFSKNQNGAIAWFQGSDYINHFNKKINKCFVIISGGTQNVEYMSVLYDAYENKELGNVHTLSDVVTSCGLYISDTYKECGNILKDKSGFSAINEFNNLTKFYMEN